MTTPPMQRLTAWLRRGPTGQRLAAASCLLIVFSMAAPWTSSSTFSMLDTGSDRWTEATDTATTGPSGAGWITVVAMLAVAAVILRRALRGEDAPRPASEWALVGALGLVELGGAIAFTAGYYSHWQGTGAYYLDTVGWGVLACMVAGALTVVAALLMRRARRRTARRGAVSPA